MATQDISFRFSNEARRCARNPAARPSGPHPQPRHNAELAWIGAGWLASPEAEGRLALPSGQATRASLAAGAAAEGWGEREAGEGGRRPCFSLNFVASVHYYTV